jgi:hypothetical protein
MGAKKGAVAPSHGRSEKDQADLRAAARLAAGLAVVLVVAALGAAAPPL